MADYLPFFSPLRVLLTSFHLYHKAWCLSFHSIFTLMFNKIILVSFVLAAIGASAAPINLVVHSPGTDSISSGFGNLPDDSGPHGLLKRGSPAPVAAQRQVWQQQLNRDKAQEKKVDQQEQGVDKQEQKVDQQEQKVDRQGRKSAPQDQNLNRQDQNLDRQDQNLNQQDRKLDQDEKALEQKLAKTHVPSPAPVRQSTRREPEPELYLGGLPSTDYSTDGDL